MAAHSLMKVRRFFFAPMVVPPANGCREELRVCEKWGLAPANPSETWRFFEDVAGACPHFSQTLTSSPPVASSPPSPAAFPLALRRDPVFRDPAACHAGAALA